MGTAPRGRTAKTQLLPKAAYLGLKQNRPLQQITRLLTTPNSRPPVDNSTPTPIKIAQQ